MSDDDLIRRGDAFAVVKGLSLLEGDILALPARGVGVDIEDMARTIYDAMRFDRKDKTPEWVNGGNSHAQFEARAAAARILAALATTDAAQAREAALRAAAAAVRARYTGDNNREDMEVLRCEAAILALIGEART